MTTPREMPAVPAAPGQFFREEQAPALAEPLPDLYYAARGHRGPDGARKDAGEALKRHVEETDERLRHVLEQGIAIWARAKPAEWAAEFYRVTMIFEGDGQKVLSADYWDLRAEGLAEPLAAELRLEQLQQVYAQQVQAYTEAVNVPQGAAGGLDEPVAPPEEPQPIQYAPWMFWPTLAKQRKWVAPRVAQEFRRVLKTHPEAFAAWLDAELMKGVQGAT